MVPDVQCRSSVVCCTSLSKNPSTKVHIKENCHMAKSLITQKGSGKGRKKQIVEPFPLQMVGVSHAMYNGKVMKIEEAVRLRQNIQLSSR